MSSGKRIHCGRFRLLAIVLMFNRSSVDKLCDNELSPQEPVPSVKLARIASV